MRRLVSVMPTPALARAARREDHGDVGGVQQLRRRRSETVPAAGGAVGGTHDDVRRGQLVGDGDQPLGERLRGAHVGVGDDLGGDAVDRLGDPLLRLRVQTASLKAASDRA